MINEPFDPLAAFFHFWMAGIRGGCPPSVHDGVTRIGEYTGLVLYRQPPFQVELWILPPNTTAPEHSHPNADIFLVHVTGELKVWVGDNLVLGPDLTVAGENGVTKSNGNFVRIAPGQKHRAETGPLGAAFMNVQMWLDGKPRSTDLDWNGDALNDNHKKKLDGLNSERIKGFVKSLSENSGGSTKGQPSISRKALATRVLPEDSTRRPLILRGVSSSGAAEDACGQVSLENRLPDRSEQQPTDGSITRP